MKEILIRPGNIVKYMGEENYRKFVDEIDNKFEEAKGFWLVAQQSEKGDIF